MCNYDNTDTDDDGSCQYTDACGVRGPGAIYDADVWIFLKETAIVTATS